MWPPVQQHHDGRQARSCQCAVLGERLDDVCSAGDLSPHEVAAAPGGQLFGFDNVVELVAVARALRCRSTGRAPASMASERGSAAMVSLPE